MAHLSAQAIAHPVTKTKIFPVWTGITSVLDLSKIDVGGTISGKVMLNNIAMPNEKVFLYYRPTGQLIYSTKSDVSGNFTFKNLDRSSNQYFSISYLKGPFTDPEKYNALVYDLLQPV